MENQDSFWEFLEELTSKDTTSKMKEEKIGPDIILQMSDEDLSKYVALHGDRLRLRTYLKDQKKDKTTGKRNKLLNILREKIETRQQSKREKEESDTLENMRGTKKQFGNRNAKKGSRRIEIGWIHKNSSGSVQVRQKKGGGTRRVTVNKDARKEDLIEEGKRLFFPDGESSKGKLADFKVDLWDFQDRSLPQTKSVGDMYDETKMPLLRFYLATVDTCDSMKDNAESSDNDTLPDLDVHVISDTDVPTSSGLTLQDLPVTRTSSPGHDKSPHTTSTEGFRETTVVHTGVLATSDQDLPTLSVPKRSISMLNTVPHATSTDMDSSETSPPGEVAYDADNIATSLPEDWSLTRTLDPNNNLAIPFDSTSPHQDLLSEAIEIAGILNEYSSLSSGAGLNDTEKASTESRKHVVRLHRGHVLREMIEAFKDIDPYSDTVYLELYMPNGEREAAEDGGGVTRDVICEFWGSFYEQCTLGSTLKVPFLRHDFGEKEWGSVAKIMCFGWISVQYFPVQLSQVFLEQCIYGHVVSNMKHDFWLYIPDGDAQILKSALVDMNSVDSDDLLDIMQQHEVKSGIRSDNIDKIINEISHKELIQSGMFVIDCWHPLLKNIGISKERLSSLYIELFPKPRRVAQILKFPDVMSADELTVSNHLRRFVRELDENLLRRFLRFCTGADLLLGKNIEVSFVNVTGLARRPVAHTCSCLLELPKFYDSFPEFRSEFLSILNANVWVMDII